MWMGIVSRLRLAWVQFELVCSHSYTRSVLIVNLRDIHSRRLPTFLISLVHYCRDLLAAWFLLS